MANGFSVREICGDAGSTVRTANGRDGLYDASKANVLRQERQDCDTSFQHLNARGVVLREAIAREAVQRRDQMTPHNQTRYSRRINVDWKIPNTPLRCTRVKVL